MYFLARDSFPSRRASLGCLLGLAALAAAPDTACADGAFPIETDAVYRASFGDQQEPHGCVGAGVWLSVWIDLRTGGLTGNGRDLYAQMVDAEGNLVFEGSLVLQRDWDRDVGLPRCTFNGTSFLVAWPEIVDGATRVMALRLAPDGTKLDAAPILVDNVGGGIAVDVASDGDGFLVTYLYAPSGLLAKRIAADGTVLDASPIPVASPSFISYRPRVAFGHGVYVATWEHNQRLRAARITPGGAVLDAQGDQVTFFPSAAPNIAANDAGFMMTWAEADDPNFANIGGAVLDPATMNLGTLRNVTGASVGHAYNGPVAFGGDGHVVLFHRPEPGSGLYVDLWARRLDVAGAPVGAIFPVTTKGGTSQIAGAVPFNGTEYMATWEDFNVGGSTCAKGGRITTAGVAYDGPQGITLSTGATWQLISGAAFDGTNYLVVWEDWRNGELNAYKSDLYAARVTPAGVVLDDPAFLIAAGGNREAEPQVIFDGVQYLVVYEYGGLSPDSIRASRILPDGTVLDPIGGVEIGEPALPTGITIRPRVAFNGSHYLVVWHNNYGFAGEVGIVGSYLDRDLNIMNPEPIGIATQSFVGSTGFDIASDGTDFVVTWTVPNGTGGDFLKATRMSSYGTALGTTTLASAPVVLENTHVAFNGAHYYVSWSKGLIYNGTLQGAMLGTDGVPMGTVTDLETSMTGHIGVVAHDGTFVIGYYKDTGGLAPGYYVKQLAADGTVLLDRHLVHAVERDEIYGNAAMSDGPGASVFATLSVWGDMPFNAPRMYGTVVPVAGGVPGDVDVDGLVGFSDILAIISAWGPCAGACPADLSGNGAVDFADILVVIANWS
ncbi:MAG: hypothetical protein ACYTGP_01070 [Planctomycetota bacterium]|jgi:hypothetical protein